MIPKTIHYCWFGRNPLPPLAVKCIKSWKKYCPDYEIIEWNEDNFDISSAPLYVRQAYEAKKWAFVTDYVRLYAMVNYGGIYMDTDVEVIRPLDKFLHHQAFSGFENGEAIPTGIMACKKDFPLFSDFLHYYDDISFYNQDGSFNYTTNVAIMTDICLELGLQPNNAYQVINGFALYPKDVFCPISYATGRLEKTKSTATIHWFAGSWKPTDAKAKHDQLLKEIKRIDRKHKILHIPHYLFRKVLGDTVYEKLKTLLKRG